MDSPTTTINTPSGPITALTTHNNTLLHARGIPYATATRFSSPSPVTQYSHDQKNTYTTPAAICPQLPSRLTSVLGPITMGHTLSESNCLNLSITAPRDLVPNSPVLVWIHGGAYISGGGDLPCYQPVDLARRGLVCVTVSYRLGVFGYLPLPGLAPANLGLLDQRAALQWVQRNIASFGGDPGNVTMVGQSAGADAIICLLVAEGAEGLFHRAILMSPPLREMKERAGRGVNGSTVERMGRQAVEIMQKEGGGGGREGQDARTMSVEELLGLQKKLLMRPVRNQIMLFAPALGFYPLPAEEEFDQKVQDGRPFASIMSGFMVKLFGLPVLGRWMEALRTWYITCSYFKWPSQRFHCLVLQAGGTSNTYSFAWKARRNPLGACHCIDIPFVLGSKEAWKDAPMLQGDGAEEEEVQRLGEEVKELWVGFAKGKELRPGHLAIGRGFTASQGVFVK